MKRNRLLLGTSVLLLVFVAIVIALFHPRTAAAQQPTAPTNPWTLHQEWREPIPKAWGKVVGYGVCPGASAGGCLVFEADDGSVRMLRVADGPPRRCPAIR